MRYTSFANFIERYKRGVVSRSGIRLLVSWRTSRCGPEWSHFWRRMLRDELNLPRRTWLELIKQCCSHSKISKIGVLDWIRANVLNGPEARISAPPPYTTRLGHVAPRSRVEDEIRKVNSFSEARSRRIVESLLHDPLNEVRNIHKSVRLAYKQMFATTDPSGKRPFEFTTLPYGSQRAAYICDSLGLPWYDLSRENAVEMSDPETLIEFVYLLPSGTVAKVPTVLDAFAGGPMNPYFEPSRSVEPPHGNSKPLSVGIPRPEVVHEAIVIGNLIDSRHSMM